MSKITYPIHTRFLMDSKLKGWINIKDILATLAKYAILQSPEKFPRNLKKVILAVQYKLSISGKFDDLEYAEFSFEELENFLDQVLKKISFFENWNLSLRELDEGIIDPHDERRPKFTFTSRYDKTKEYEDFIDLDALIRNIASECIKDGVEAVQ